MNKVIIPSHSLKAAYLVSKDPEGGSIIIDTDGTVYGYSTSRLFQSDRYGRAHFVIDKPQKPICLNLAYLNEPDVSGANALIPLDDLNDSRHWCHQNFKPMRWHDKLGNPIEGAVLAGTVSFFEPETPSKHKVLDVIKSKLIEPNKLPTNKPVFSTLMLKLISDCLSIDPYLLPSVNTPPEMECYEDYIKIKYYGLGVLYLASCVPEPIKNEYSFEYEEGLA